MRTVLLILTIFSSLVINAKNLSEDYSRTKKSLSKIHEVELKNRLKDMTVVLLPGILSETVIDGSKQPLNFSLLLGDYFKDYMTWLDSVGIKNTRIIVESEDTVENNSKFIVDQLRKVKGDIVVVTHSKGGNEFLDVLLSEKSIRKRTKGWIAMQTPFYGAYIADFFANTRGLRIGTEWVFTFFGGSLDGLKSVGTQKMNKYHKLNKSKIKKVVQDINLLQYVTYIKNEFGPESPLESLRDLILSKRGRNDGLVEVGSAYLPYGNYIVDDGVDHLATVLNFKHLRLLPSVVNRYKNWNFNRVEHIKTLLYLNTSKLK